MNLLLFGRIMKSSFYVWINVLEFCECLYPWTYDNWEINLHCIVMQQTSTRQKLVVSQVFKNLSCIITISLEFVSQDEKWIIAPSLIWKVGCSNLSWTDQNRLLKWVLQVHLLNILQQYMNMKGTISFQWNIKREAQVKFKAL